jgi:FdhE protein
MTPDDWLRAHPLLEPVARLHARVEAALAGIATPVPPPPSWDDYLADYSEGIPLLQSSGAPIELLPAGILVCSLVGALATGAASDPLAADAGALRAELGILADPARGVVDWLLGDAALQPSNPGLLRFLGWTATRRWLQPVVGAFARWRDEERWLRRYCPTCGSPPAMAWLVGVDPGHQRFLACGGCGTRWRYRRTACPFCEHESHRLGVVVVQSEPGFRIDWCEGCRGYLKAYQGQGNEAIGLADWTTLHLDVAAQQRGLQRLAASLYDLDGLLDGPAQPIA